MLLGSVERAITKDDMQREGSERKAEQGPNRAEAEHGQKSGAQGLEGLIIQCRMSLNGVRMSRERRRPWAAPAG